MSNGIAAVVLAAGMSRRMGQPKALLPLGGMPMIARVVEPLGVIEAIDPIVVVTGHQANEVVDSLGGAAVEFVHNPDYEVGGMLSSVKAGCRAVAQRCCAFFLVLGDQPLVEPSTYRELLSGDTGLWPVRAVAHGQAALGAMVQPTFDGRGGHPILLSSECIDGILALPDDGTLKDFTARIDATEIPVDDPGVLADIDTPQDYDLAVQKFLTDRSNLCQSKV